VSPKITIVTPSFNQGAFLEIAIRSVLDQRYPELEYIVLDGGSTDGSAEIIKRYSRHLAFWRSKTDGGQADAVASGFRMGTGEILGWLNSDDLLREDALRRVATVFADHPSTGLVYGERDYIDTEGRVIGHYRPPSILGACYFDLGQWIPQEAAFFRRTAYEAVGGIDPSMYFAMDFSLFARMFGKTRFRRIPGTLGAMRLHPSSKTSRNADVMVREGEKARRELSVPRVPGGPLIRKLVTRAIYAQGSVQGIAQAFFAGARIGPADVR
jgi:glycosyltransferase involved in cell wall biosynthesis